MTSAFSTDTIACGRTSVATRRDRSAARNRAQRRQQPQRRRRPRRQPHRVRSVRMRHVRCTAVPIARTIRGCQQHPALRRQRITAVLDRRIRKRRWRRHAASVWSGMRTAPVSVSCLSGWFGGSDMLVLRIRHISVYFLLCVFVRR